MRQREGQDVIRKDGGKEAILHTDSPLLSLLALRFLALPPSSQLPLSLFRGEKPQWVILPPHRGIFLMGSFLYALILASLVIIIIQPLLHPCSPHLCMMWVVGGYKSWCAEGVVFFARQIFEAHTHFAAFPPTGAFYFQYIFLPLSC